MSIQELDKKYIADTYARFDLVIESGKGSILIDEKGKEYIDLGSGIAVNTFGIADEHWKKAIIEQISLISHTSNYYYTAPDAKLAELLCKVTGMEKVFFSNSGAEANECAIKAARKYSFDKYGENRNVIITLKNSFHGRTVTTISATGQDSFHTIFHPFTPGFIYAEVNDILNITDLMKNESVCAVMIEIIQGEGGINVLDSQYVLAIAKLAKELDILLMVDEVQTGNGRTGKMYSYMHMNITPDIITTAKGLGGGLPIGATIFGEKVSKVLTPGTHGSTFGGNPVCAAGSISILSRITDELMTEVSYKSEYIKNELKNAKGVISITGLGLMLGIKTEKSPKDIISECMDKGVLVLLAKDKVRLLPALNIPMNQLIKAISILKGVIEQ